MTSRLGGHLDQTVFIVSTGRTGTNAIAHYLSDLGAGVRAVHEPKPSRIFRVISNMHLCGRISTDTVAAALRATRRRHLAALTSGTYVESNPFLHGCLDALEEAFENVRVLHILREPIGYIRSHINHGVFVGLKGLAGRRFPYWLLKPDYFDAASRLHWISLSQEERLAWRWATINSVLDEGERLFGYRYRRIRYEDLFNGPVIESVMEWLSLPGSDRLRELAAERRYNESRVERARPLEDWPDPVRQRVRELCEAGMIRYGYDPDRIANPVRPHAAMTVSSEHAQIR